MWAEVSIIHCISVRHQILIFLDQTGLWTFLFFVFLTMQWNVQFFALLNWKINIFLSCIVLDAVCRDLNVLYSLDEVTSSATKPIETVTVSFGNAEMPNFSWALSWKSLGTPILDYIDQDVDSKFVNSTSVYYNFNLCSIKLSWVIIIKLHHSFFLKLENFCYLGP